MIRTRRFLWGPLAILLLSAPAFPQTEGPQPPPPAVEHPSGEGGAVDEEVLATFRVAAKVLEQSTEVAELVRASATLQDGLPDSRSVLHRCVERGSRQARGIALRILGEAGEASLDLEVAGKALRDPDAKVRLAAVLAVRRLGRLGFPLLVDYLPGELDVNNKKMAVQTLKEWRNDDAVPMLVGMLKEEKDKGVRNYIVSALEGLTKRRLGHDVQAWEEHVEAMELLDQAGELLEKEKGQLLRQTEENEERNP